MLSPTAWCTAEALAFSILKLKASLNRVAQTFRQVCRSCWSVSEPPLGSKLRRQSSKGRYNRAVDKTSRKLKDQCSAKSPERVHRLSSLWVGVCHRESTTIASRAKVPFKLMTTITLYRDSSRSRPDLNSTVVSLWSRICILWSSADE